MLTIVGIVSWLYRFNIKMFGCYQLPRRRAEGSAVCTNADINRRVLRISSV